MRKYILLSIVTDKFSSDINRIESLRDVCFRDFENAFGVKVEEVTVIQSGEIVQIGNAPDKA